MTYNFSFPSFYGEGIRYALLLSSDIIKNVRLTAKAATTNYFDRNTIGTAQQQIDQSSMTDIQLQLRWLF